MSNCTYKNFWSTFLLHWKYVATIWLHFRLAHIYLSNNLIFSDQITGCKSKAHVKMCSNNDQFDIFCQVQQKRMWENEKPNRNKNADSKWDFLIPLGRSHVKKSIRMKKHKNMKHHFISCRYCRNGKYDKSISSFWMFLISRYEELRLYLSAHVYN